MEQQTFGTPSEPPPPDNKDWTWVLDRTCEECGLDVSAPDRGSLAASVRANAASWRAALNRGDMVAQRPPVASGASARWSALEYACHVRDVLDLFNRRLTEMIKGKSPTFEDWDQDRAAASGDYAGQDPEKVSYALAVNAGKVADLLDRVRDSKWSNAGKRSDGVEFTVESLARYLYHDIAHHLWDANRGFDAIKEERKRQAKLAQRGSGAGVGDHAEQPEGG